MWSAGTAHRISATMGAKLPMTGAQMGGTSMRVVLVDDDDRFRAMACRALAADGVEIVAEADNGEDTFAVVARSRPDVVLVDIRLPGIDGLEVARQLGTQEAGPVVILISTLDAAYGRRVAAGLAAGFLPKNELSFAAIAEIAGLAPRP
jgi:DNA-binding NarL/FixJ family response regulator